MMRINRIHRASIAFAVLAGGLLGLSASQEGSFQWKVHDQARPKPPVVAPGTPATLSSAGTAPTDSIVLLGGDTGLSEWRNGESDCKWTLNKNGTMQVKPRTGNVSTRQTFGDVHLHVEWMIPEDRECSGQHGCNSGVFFMDRYEVQILGTHNNVSYADGMAGSLYGQHPPLANPCRPNGEWNVYDILFRAPRFAEDGTLASPAVVTVFFNDILVQYNAVMTGETSHGRGATYTSHAAKLPIQLQDHSDPITFGNIWVRPLPGSDSAE